MFMHEHQTYKPPSPPPRPANTSTTCCAPQTSPASPHRCPPATRTAPQDADARGGGAFNGPLD
jgi:hypothetical protein